MTWELCALIGGLKKQSEKVRVNSRRDIVKNKQQGHLLNLCTLPIQGPSGGNLTCEGLWPVPLKYKGQCDTAVSSWSLSTRKENIIDMTWPIP